MSKFEQLLDLIVNEEMDKANELFHEIVVEKSRDIYENLIAEEAEEEMDEEAEDDTDDSVDEAAEDEEDMDESADEDMDESAEELEDSYSMEADDEEGSMGGPEQTDDFGADIGAMDDEGDAEEGGEESAIFDIKNAIADLEAAFADLEASQGGGEGDATDFGDEEGEEDGDEMMGRPAFEGRRVTREYVEKVGNDWDKNSQKTQAEYIGAKTGGVEGKPVEGRSPISSGSGKPNSGANAKNLAQSHHEGGTDKGTSPSKVNKGINPDSGEKFAKGIHNVDGAKSGVKTLSNVKGGHGAEKRGSSPSPVGSGTGDKAGQTSMGNQQSLLKKL